MVMAANHRPFYFNPRPPRGGRQQTIGKPRVLTNYFNPRPPRGGRQKFLIVGDSVSDISIHAPREGGDQKELDKEI